MVLNPRPGQAASLRQRGLLPRYRRLGRVGALGVLGSGLLGAACEDNTVEPAGPPYVGAVTPDAGGAAGGGGSGGSGGGGGAGGGGTGGAAALDAGAAEACPALALPIGAGLEAGVGVALTTSRAYLANGSTLFVHERAGGCAGALLETHTAGAPGGRISGAGIHGVAGIAATDDALVATDSAALRLSSAGAIGDRPCSFEADSVATAAGALVGAALLRAGGAAARVTLVGGGCESEAQTPPALVHVAVGALASGDLVVAAIDEPSEPVRVRRAGGTGGVVACSARAVVTLGARVAVLDPVCGAVRLFDAALSAEEEAIALPAGVTARGMAAVPGEVALSVLSVDAVGAPALHVLRL
ncbi:MAG: hypothetical protein IT376_04035 [Polyangiaceae bacterium]|nr:hypothetical protein [Polyangiaceae bacterium]